MVKTKDRHISLKSKTLEHNMNYMIYQCSGILREIKGGGCTMLQ